MKFFDKTLDEIYEIISEINDELSNCLPLKEQDWFIGISFEFNEWYGVFELNGGLFLISTENDFREYYEDIDQYEDLKDAIKRRIGIHCDYYSQFKSVCNVEN